MSKPNVFPSGQIIIFTEGEYDDYGIDGVVVTITECDLPKLVKEYEKSEPRKGTYCKPSAFVPWLIAQQHVMSVDVAQVHLGSSYDFDKELTMSDEERIARDADIEKRRADTKAQLELLEQERKRKSDERLAMQQPNEDVVRIPIPPPHPRRDKALFWAEPVNK